MLIGSNTLLSPQRRLWAEYVHCSHAGLIVESVLVFVSDRRSLQTDPAKTRPVLRFITNCNEGAPQTCRSRINSRAGPTGSSVVSVLSRSTVDQNLLLMQKKQPVQVTAGPSQLIVSVFPVSRKSWSS